MTEYDLSRTDIHNLTRWEQVCKDLTEISPAYGDDQRVAIGARIRRAKLQSPEGKFIVETQALSVIGSSNGLFHYAERIPALRANVLALGKPQGWIDYILYTAATVLGNHLVRIEADDIKTGWFDQHFPREQAWQENIKAMASKDMRLLAYRSLLLIGCEAPQMRAVAAQKMFSELLNVSEERQVKELRQALPFIPEKSEQARHATTWLKKLQPKR